MAITWVGSVGSSSLVATGAVNGLVIPVSGVPSSDATTSVCLVVTVLYGPTYSGTIHSGITITDDAPINGPYGSRFSPYGGTTAIIGTSVDPPVFTPANDWVNQTSTGEETGVFYLRYIGEPPSNVILTFRDTQDYAYATVYCVQGLAINATLSGGTEASPVTSTNASLTASYGPGPTGSFSVTSGLPGLSLGIFQEFPTPVTVGTPIVNSDDGLYTLLDQFSAADGSVVCQFVERIIASSISSMALTWDTGPGKSIATRGDYPAGDGAPIPDVLSVSLSTSVALVGSVNRYTVTIVDASGLPSDTVSHFVTPYWRVTQAPDMSNPGLDGTWIDSATDVSSNGQYVITAAGNPYIDVPSGSVYTVNAVLYDGIGYEASVSLLGPGARAGALYESDGTQWVQIA